MFGCEVQGGVALVCVVGIEQVCGMNADDALDEEDVIEEDGAPQARACVDPEL